jgi:hypothetical protein
MKSKGAEMKIKKILSKEWDGLVETLGVDLEASSREYGAQERVRGIKTASGLLRMIMIYAILQSLLSTAFWCIGLGISQISRQALDKRIAKSTNWLRYLVSASLKQFETPFAEAPALGIRRWVLRDASVIARPGSAGTEWRIHLSWQPFRQQPAEVTVSDSHTGEGVSDAGLQADDLVIADRAYGLWSAIEIALNAFAFFIFRLTWSNLPLLRPDGQPFDPVAWLDTWPENQMAAEMAVCLSDDPQQRRFRLVAGRLPADKAKEAQDKVRKKAKEEKREVNPKTLLAASFCLLLTNLPVSLWSTALVLAAYRIRWQIEWTFRRWKDLCLLDHLPAFPSALAEPVLLAKLLLILILQRQVALLPWSDWLAEHDTPPTLSPIVKAIFDHLLELIRPTHLILQFLDDPTPFLKLLRSAKRKRPLQLAAAFHSFLALPP